MAPFADFDHDGYRDFVQVLFLQSNPLTQLAVQIQRGTDGAVLWQQLNGAAIHAVYAGDVNADGQPDVAILRSCCVANTRTIDVWSPATNQLLWQATGTSSGLYGTAMLGGLDTNGDGFGDFVATTSHPNESDIYVYDHLGNVRYTLPCSSIGYMAYSLAKMGDMDGDGCDDFLVGCGDPQIRGALVLVSGLTGSILRISYGLQVGDKTFAEATNLGDIDGDGVDDYAAFPFWSAWRHMGVAFSGATGNVIHTVPYYAESVVATEDLDLDGVRDLVVGGDYAVNPPNVYGRTYALSGRDGSELWRVDNFLAAPGTGSNGSTGWAEYAAGLGVLPGSPYPAIAWMDLEWVVVGTSHGRVRAFRGIRAGQGPVTGTPCSSTTSLPQIGARDTATGSRITIAHAAAGAAAWLNVALGNQTSYFGQPLPISLDPYGLTGCNLYVGPEAAVLRILGTNGIDRGYGAVDLNFHLVPAGLGTVITAQWLVFDPTTFGYAATQMHELRMQ